MNLRRRDLIKVIAGSAVAWPPAVRAQQPAKVPRVGILSPAASETAATLAAFREGIRDLGYIEGQTIAFDFRLSKGIVDALPALAVELARIPVDVIVTDFTTATLAAFGATRTIPIVMASKVNRTWPRRGQIDANDPDSDISGCGSSCPSQSRAEREHRATIPLTGIDQPIMA